MRGHLPPERLLEKNRPGILVLDEGAQRTASRAAEPGQLFEGPEHLRQPRLKNRAFDLRDIPVQNQKRGACRCGLSAKYVTAVASLSVPVLEAVSMTAKTPSHATGKGKRLVVSEELFATKEGDARPVDEFGEIFLGIDQGVVVLAQVGVKSRLALTPSLDALILRALRQKSDCRGSWHETHGSHTRGSVQML